MASIQTGGDVMRMIEDAFGLSPNTNRIVDCVARIIRVDYLDKDQATALVEQLKRCNAEVV